MKTTTKLMLAFATTALMAPGLAQAAAAKYEIEGAHTVVEFGVRHLGINTVKGTFKSVTGSITYDAAKPEATVVNAEIDANSLDTGNVKRDGHVKSPDFLDTAQFPKITFASKSAKASGKDVVVTGDLTIHGVKKEVTLTLSDLAGPGLSPLDKKNHVGASASTKIKRQDFGLNWNGGGVTGLAGEAAIGDDVKIQLEVDGVEVAAKGK